MQKKAISILLVLVLVFSLLPAGAIAAETNEMVIKSPMMIDGTFEYPADHLKEDNLISDYTAKFGFHYDESWFENSATMYQHDLARMSLRMTMTGMTRRDFDDATNTSHVEDLLTKLEFSNQVLNFPQPEVNTIGYCIGSKNIQSSSGEVYSLIAVVMRSSGYQDEWGGNLTIGQSGNHAGFQLAADKTLSAIRSYIGELTGRGQLTNKIKIWISGYSRGAAAANLAAAKLNEQFGKENVFAYCFECPQGAVGSDVGGERYSNIFCIRPRAEAGDERVGILALRADLLSARRLEHRELLSAEGEDGQRIREPSLAKRRDQLGSWRALHHERAPDRIRADRAERAL